MSRDDLIASFVECWRLLLSLRSLVFKSTILNELVIKSFENCCGVKRGTDDFVWNRSIRFRPVTDLLSFELSLRLGRMLTHSVCYVWLKSLKSERILQACIWDSNTKFLERLCWHLGHRNLKVSTKPLNPWAHPSIGQLLDDRPTSKKVHTRR